MNHERPDKPHPDFPLFANQNGQWTKKIKGKPYYFGSWREDPKGERAIKEYVDRLPGILAGTDHLRHLSARRGQASVGELLDHYLAQRRLDVQAGTLARITFGGYASELFLFRDWVRGTAAVAALKPAHFGGYVAHLIENRKLKARARKRVQAYIKAMFRWGAENDYCPLPKFGTSFRSPSTTPQAMRLEKARAGLPDFSKRIVTGEEIDRLLDASQPNMRAMILLGINCGLGPADIGRLRWRHINMETGMLDYPREKTGCDRVGYLWKRTRAALEDVRRLKHTAILLEREGQDALVFVTRKRQPYYREWDVVKDGEVAGTQFANAISITFGRLAVKLDMRGVTFYRLRHTFKTAGKRAKDRDALNLAMGHKANSIEASYDHEEISFRRVKRVAIAVKHRLWPRP